MRRLQARSGPDRLVGVDVARAVAIIGMFFSHTAPNGRGVDFADGHPTVLFATLAGVSLGLLSGGARPAVGRSRRAVCRTVAVRAVLLIVLGRLLWSLGTPIAVILDSYGALFLVLLPALFAKRAALAGVVAFSITAGSLLIVGAGPDLLAAYESKDPLQWPGQWLLTGFYPVAILLAYAATGLICARSDLARRRTQVWMLAVGAVASAGGYLLAARLGVDAGPHADNGWEAVASGGFAVAVIGGLQLVCALRPVRAALSVLADAGSMPLTIYTAQVVASAFLVAAVPAAGGTSGIGYWWFFWSLTLGSIAFAAVWRRLVGRGPLEQLFADVSGSSRAADRGGPDAGPPAAPVSPSADPSEVVPRASSPRPVAVPPPPSPASADELRATPPPAPAHAPAAPAPIVLTRPERRSPRRFLLRLRRRAQGALVMTGVRRRPVAFLGLVLLTGGAVVVSVTAPLLLRAAQQSSLGAVAGPSTAPAVLLTYDTRPDARLGQDVLRPASLWRASAPVSTSGVATTWSLPDSTRRPSGHLVASPECAGVVLSRGRCPVGLGEVAVPDDSGAGIGQDVDLGSGGGDRLTVVGAYRRGTAGGPFQDRAVAAALRTVDPASRAEDLLVHVAQLNALQDGYVTAVPVSLRHPLRLEEVRAVRASLAEARREIGTVAGAGIATPVTEVIDAQQHTAGAASLIALALAAQTLAVAWAAQALIVGAVARSRAGEWGVARLRGFRTPRRLLAVFAEPLLAVVVGAVAGAAVAVLLAQAVVTATSGGLVQPLQPLPLTVGALAVLGCLVALVLASVHAATLPLAQLLRERAEPRRIGRLSLVAQSGVVLATGLVLYSVVTGGAASGPQLPLFAPALVAVTIGLLALRVALPLLRRRLHGPPRSLLGTMVGRRVVRTPSLLATAVVVCVAVALATTALQTSVVSARLQHVRAQATVGATRVLDVDVPSGVDLVAAVRRADPGGRAAMAVEDLADGAGPQRIVAVDTARLAAVSSWDADWGRATAAGLRRALSPAVGPAVRLRGSRITVVVKQARMLPNDRGFSPIGLSDLDLSMRVQDARGFQPVELGRLDGSRFTAPLPCRDGCRIVDVTVVNRGQGASWSAQLVLASMATDEQPIAALASSLDPDRWRQQLSTSTSLDEPPTVDLERADSGLRLVLDTPQARAVTGIAPLDAPQAVPVLIGPGLRLSPVGQIPGTAFGSGLGFESLLVRPVGRAVILPRALDDGAMVDLSLMRRISNPAASQAQPQVWLSAAAGPATIRALRAQGLGIGSVQRLSTVEAGYLSGTVPRVAGQGAAIGLTGLALALLALLAAQLLRRPAQRATAEVLRAAGATPRAVRRVAMAESAIPAAAGALLGAVAGVLGSAAVLRALPLGAGAGPVPPVDHSIAASALLLPLLAALAAVTAIAVATTVRRRSR